MTIRKRLILLFPLILVSLSCQAVTSIFPPAASPTPVATLTATATWTPLPDTATPSPTITPLPPTATIEPTATLAPLTSDERLEIFEKLWNIINDNYVYKDFNGVDWEAVHEEYAPKVKAASDPEAFYTVLNEMIFLLNDEHSVFLTPRDVAEGKKEYMGETEFVGVGILTRAVFERKYATVLLTFPDSPAAKAGIKMHDNILSVDGTPIIQGEEYNINMLRGPEGSQVTVEVQTPGEAPRQLTLTRRQIQEGTPVPYQVLTTPDGKRIGYILVVTFSDITINGQVENALTEMAADAPLDGVIVDNRLNPGGADTITKAVLGMFTKGTLGYFYDRQDNRRDFSVVPVDIHGSQKFPMVVLVGKGTASFGELFAGVLQDSHRAYIIGETTDGNVELLRVYDFEDGSSAWIAHEKFHPIYHPADDWEATGIIPNETVLSEWDQVTTETDPVILASLEYFDSN